MAQVTLAHGSQGQLSGSALQQARSQALFKLGNAP
jgi:hypothetical protein